MCDFDNFVAGCKQLVDALGLKHTGFIFDDAPEYLEVTYKQQVSKQNNTEVFRAKMQTLEP